MTDANTLPNRNTFERKRYGRLCLVGWAQRIRLRANPPPNSLPIVALAHELNYDAVEIDIRIAADDVPVLAHDDTLKSPEGQNIVIAENTSDSLLKFQIGACGGVPTYIPTLVEALTLAGPMDVQLDARIAASQIHLLRKAVEAAGFDPRNLQFCVYDKPMAKELIRVFPESVLLWKQIPPQKPVTQHVIEAVKEIGVDGIMVRFPRDEHDFESLTALTRPQDLRVLVYIHGREKPYPNAVNEALNAIQQAGIDYVTTFAGETDEFKKIKAVK